ncbi:uncharacterized protein [Montipora capricornis]|uniref:uncharacterized protein isoform X2 n=1 Tax=Montipora capricornis TaxID=246305 RepID=UPI0035F11DDB
MSFGGRSFKKEELRLKKELQKLTKQSKNEFAVLNTSDKSKLLESSSKTSKPAKKQIKIKQKIATTHEDETSNSDGEIPPPSPSIDLEAEMRTLTTPGIDDAKAALGEQQELQRSVAVERRNSDIISRSTGVASIRSRVDLNVVMYGKGLGDENNPMGKPKRSVVKPQSAQSRNPKSPERSPLPDDVPAKKPAIIGSQSTAVAVQLALRPAPKPPRVSSGSHAESTRTCASSLKDWELFSPNTPTSLIDGNAVIVNAGDEDSQIFKERLEVKWESDQFESNPNQEKRATEESHEYRTTEISVDYEIQETKEEGENTEAQSEDKQEDAVLVTTSSPALNIEEKQIVEQESEDESPVSRIHSQILELTRKISLPETGLLNLIRATEEAENESKKQREGVVASSLSKDSLLRRAMGDHGSSDFKLYRSLRNSLHQDPKQAFSNPSLSKTSAPGDKTKLQVDDLAPKTSVEMESFDTDARKEKLSTVLKSDSVVEDGNANIQVAAELPKTEGKEDTGRSRETTKRDQIASQPFTILQSQERTSRSMTNEQALECIQLAPEVFPEDIISIQGHNVQLESKDIIAPTNSSDFLHQELKKQWIDLGQHKNVLFLDTWEVTDKGKENKAHESHNIHHFCTMPSRVELPPHLCRKTRDEHTRDKFHKIMEKAPDGNFKFLEGMSETSREEAEQGRTDSQGLPVKGETEDDRRWSLVAQKILMDAVVAGDSDETLTRLKKASDNLFSAERGESLDIVGVKLQLKDDTSRLYWTPAPPKMNLLPATIKSQLYPDYQGALLLQESVGTELRTLTAGFDSDDEDDDMEAEIETGDQKARNRILSREHGSLSDLGKLKTEMSPVQRPKTHIEQSGTDQFDTGGASGRFVSVLDKRRQQIKQQDGSVNVDQVITDDEEGTDAQKQQDQRLSMYRSVSHPLLSSSNEKALKVSAEYDISMDELNYQREQVAAIKELQKANEDSIAPREKPPSAVVTETSLAYGTLTDFPIQSQFDSDEGRIDAGDSMSIQTGTTTTLTTHRKSHRRMKKKAKKEMEREQQIREFRKRPARKISRCVSFPDLRNLQRKTSSQRRTSVRSGSRLSRANSQPTFLDFDSTFKSERDGSRPASFDETREQVWFVWFDEVYPPTPTVPEIKLDFQTLSTPRPQTQSKSTEVDINDDILEDIQVIEPQIRTSDQKLYEALQDEVGRLAELINTTSGDESVAIFLCRRGAVYRKLGQLKKAWDDLNRSIKLEPKLLDAYWHRHLLHLLQENRKAALDDLSYIIKNSSTHARAFRSRAELYRLENDPTMAIVNYSQAIKLNPNDAETYYQRAAMFKMRGDTILALEDYKKAAELLPSKTDAMFEIGLFHFENENWTTALKDFTIILEQDSEDSLAYTYRAKVHAKMGDFERALKDLAAAVHFNPNNAEAFCQRGCLLRKVHPRRALQDLSVSLLLDNSEKNGKAFLHRGILYTDLKRWEDAVPDFEAALQLDATLASAHVNIGLICIIKYTNYHKAVRRYTAAIRVDPTYIRAYLCRAEAYQKLNMLQEAVLDYTRVIHMRPDIADYHMARGKLLLEQNKLEFASFHVRQAAELNRGLGASATQQAVVQSFLKNYDQAIEVLERATRSKPVAPLFVLLGKTNMKAKRFEDAIRSFDRAITIMTPWNSRMEMPIEAAYVYFLIGMCHSELSKPLDALSAFNNAIRVNPDYAEAFYQRGLTKMKLNHAKGIHDFNRALAINPSLFQAFLSRAAYYGMKGRFSKGIMSCNEAIKLQPRSVRAYLYRGALKYNIKAFSLAVKDLTEAVAIDCKCSLAYFNRAVCYHEMRYFQKALMDYGTVMLLDEEPNLKVLQNRGLLYFEIDDIDNALQDFLAASEVSPNNPHIRHTLGLCYHRLKRLQESVSSYNDALRIDPFFVEAYNGRGNALMDFGHDDGTVLGRRDYLKALHIDPLCLSARVNLGYNLQVEGRFQSAWNLFSSAITIDSGCQSALEGRAVVNLQMGNTFGAFVDMNDAIKISKTAELLTNRGVVHQFMGDFVNAIRDYQAAVKTDPSYALAYYNAANVYFRQRQFQQALSYFNKALSWYADDESAILNRAITKVMLKDTRGAVQDFNRAVELNPYAAHVYFNRGNLYASLRKYKESEEDYTRALSLKPGDALVYKRRADVLGKQGKKAAALEDYKRAIVIQTRKH